MLIILQIKIITYTVVIGYQTKNEYLRMKSSKVILFLLFSVFSTMIFAQHKLNLNIEGVPSEKGSICYAVYDNESSFLKLDKVFKSGLVKAETGLTTIEINDLPDGDYAIAIFHDANGNEILDTNMLGIPKEQVGFTKGKLKMFGPPKYNECTFMLNSNMEMNIRLQ